MSDLIQHFGIDWKLLLVQVVNFFILLIVLKKFAYQPILQMLRKRREDIEKGVLMSAEARIRLEGAEKEREAILATSHRESLALVTAAEATAEKRKEEVLADATKKTERIVADAKRTIQEERSRIEEDVYHSSRALVEEGIKRLLGRLPERERDHELINEALREAKGALRHHS